jgi:hypothetical protein
MEDRPLAYLVVSIVIIWYWYQAWSSEVRKNIFTRGAEVRKIMAWYLGQYLLPL